jgi:UTP-glucose-1-phosphate uridylyltransferase
VDKPKIQYFVDKALVSGIEDILVLSPVVESGRSLLKIQPVYAYNFEGRRYDVGDKQGFLEATVEYALRRPDLHDGFLKYLKEIIVK